MFSFAVMAIFLFGPFMVFSPELDSGSRIILIILDVCVVIPFWLHVFVKSKAMSTKEGRKKTIEKTKKENDYANKYGIIEWDDKK